MYQRAFSGVVVCQYKQHPSRKNQSFLKTCRNYYHHPSNSYAVIILVLLQNHCLNGGSFAKGKEIRTVTSINSCIFLQRKVPKGSTVSLSTSVELNMLNVMGQKFMLSDIDKDLYQVSKRLHLLENFYKCVNNVN